MIQFFPAVDDYLTQLAAGHASSNLHIYHQDISISHEYFAVKSKSKRRNKGKNKKSGGDKDKKSDSSITHVVVPKGKDARTPDEQHQYLNIILHHEPVDKIEDKIILQSLDPRKVPQFIYIYLYYSVISFYLHTFIYFASSPFVNCPFGF